MNIYILTHVQTCGLNHFDLSDKGMQAFLRHQSDCKFILVDLTGNPDLHLSKMVIAQSRINGGFGHWARKDTGIVSKCDGHDIRRGPNGAVTKQVCAVCITSIKFHKFPLAGGHFNFFSIRVGSSANIIPNEVISLLKSIIKEICKALKGTLPAVLFLEKECSTNDPLPGHLGVARQTYDELMSTVLRDSNMTMVCNLPHFQVHMRGRELLGHGSEPCETLFIPSERGGMIKASWEKIMHTNASNSIINTTEQMYLGLALTDGAEIFHPDIAKELLFHLRLVHRCNASPNPLQVVATDTEFDANHDSRRE